MESAGSDSPLRDTLLALPRWTAYTAIGLLACGVLTGIALLAAPGLEDALRGTGGQLLVVCLPVLSVAVGVLGASRTRTERIDALVADYLRQTLKEKLRIYLVREAAASPRRAPFPPLFERMEQHCREELTSFCAYRFFDANGRRFDLLVKSNVYNFELSMRLHLRRLPTGVTAAHLGSPDNYQDLEEWPRAQGNPLVNLVPSVVHGSLAEGYTIYVDADPAGEGMVLRLKLRQKLRENFLTSPYLRRYFAEDAAIAAHVFYSEAFAADLDITGGELD